ncbi:MAG: pyridoxal-phosphate dependent enzyme [Candidatus Hodarchaeota archaeon]
MVLRCIKCNKEVLKPLGLEALLWHENCGGMLEYSPLNVSKEKINLKRPEKGIWSYEAFLPDIDVHITLGEAHTPLLSLQRIAGLKSILVKVESRNPTGSFRDRAAAVITSHAKSVGAKELWCATNGNFGASLSAYCAATSLTAKVVAPRTIDVGKKSQIYAFGAEVIEKGEILDKKVFKFVQEEVISASAYQATPEFNILAIEGQKTLGLELALEKQVETIIVPLGSGSLLYSIWRGLADALESNLIETIPTLIGVQVEALDKNGSDKSILKSPARAASLGASSLLVGQPLFAEVLQKILKSCNGTVISISPEDLVPTAIELATKEGLFVEPSSSSAIIATKNLVQANEIDIKHTIIILTGAGLKSPNIYAEHSRALGRKVWGLGATITTKFEILEIIKEQQNAFGYSLWQDLGGKKKISRQAVYQHLRELVEKGLLSIIDAPLGKDQSSRRRTYYKLTPKGKRALESMRVVIDALS